MINNIFYSDYEGRAIDVPEYLTKDKISKVLEEYETEFNANTENKIDVILLKNKQYSISLDCDTKEIKEDVAQLLSSFVEDLHNHHK